MARNLAGYWRFLYNTTQPKGSSQSYLSDKIMFPYWPSQFQALCLQYFTPRITLFLDFTHRLLLKNLHISDNNSLLVLRWKSGKASRRLKIWDLQESCDQWFGKLREFNRLYIFVSIQDLSTGDKGKYSLRIVWKIRRRTWSRTRVNLNDNHVCILSINLFI
jgi:hypothetical protein